MIACAVRLLLFLLFASALAVAPFAFLRRPWAVRIWRRFRLILVIYVLVIVTSAIVSLVLRWDDIYG